MILIYFSCAVITLCSVILTHDGPVAGGVSYFPPSAFSPSVVAWYSDYLTAFGEPSLIAPLDNESETYRLLWLRSFHHPILVRIQLKGTSVHFVTKELNGRGGYETGELIVNRETALSAREWTAFLTLLDQASFWQMPTTEERGFGADGAQWVLEGVKDGSYHVVDRWSEGAEPFRKACLYLLELSGLKPAPIY